jgi:hypothetical protein
MAEEKEWRISTLKSLLIRTKEAVGFELVKGLVKREMAKTSDIIEDKFFGIAKDDDDEGGG